MIPILLPTNAQSASIGKDSNGKLSLSTLGREPHNLHIIEFDVDILESDYYIDGFEMQIKRCQVAKIRNPNFGKIIATTNRVLKLPVIDNNFLKLYITRQGMIDEVEVDIDEHPNGEWAIAIVKELDLNKLAFEAIQNKPKITSLALEARGRQEAWIDGYRAAMEVNKKRTKTGI